MLMQMQLEKRGVCELPRRRKPPTSDVFRKDELLRPDPFDTGPITIEDSLLSKVPTIELLNAVWFHERGLAKQWKVPLGITAPQSTQEQSVSCFRSINGTVFAVVTDVVHGAKTHLRLYDELSSNSGMRR